MYIAQNTTKRIAIVFLTYLPQKYQLSKKLHQYSEPFNVVDRGKPNRRVGPARAHTIILFHQAKMLININ